MVTGSKVWATLGSSKTGNLRAVAGVVQGWVTQPIPGTRSAYVLAQVLTPEGVLLVANSRLRPVGGK